MAQEVTNFARFYALFNNAALYRRPGRAKEANRSAVHVGPYGKPP